MKNFLAIALLLIFVTSINTLRGFFCALCIEAFSVIAPRTVEVTNIIRATVNRDAGEDCGDSCWHVHVKWAFVVAVLYLSFYAFLAVMKRQKDADVALWSNQNNNFMV
jgi:hypothetical protein